MMEQLDFEKYIQRYLDGGMHPEEKKWFEKELEGNESLRRKLKLHKEVDLVLKDKEVLDFKKKLESIHEEIHEPGELKVKSTNTIGRTISFAALGLIITGISVYFLLSGRQYSPEDIYSAYYEPYESVIKMRSADNKADKLLVNAIQLYEAGEYAEALPLFQEIIEKDTSKVEMNLYSGISQMEVKKYKEASGSFKTIIDQNDNLYIEQAEWYLSFCYLMTDQIPLAIKSFKEIADSNGFYQKKAQEIIKKIK